MAFFSFLLFTLLSTNLFAATDLRQSQQLLVLSLPSSSSFQAKLHRYERNSIKSSWQESGPPSPAVIGQKGASTHKQEGDNKTPLGLFPLQAAFGFSPQAPTLRLASLYHPLLEDSLCIDDPKSHYYNQIVEKSSIPHPDWRSAEQMREQDLYRWGLVLSYPTKSTSGSCLFIHRERSATQGTAGCVGLPETSLQQLLAWLNWNKKPMIAILTLNEEKAFKKKWALP